MKFILIGFGILLIYWALWALAENIRNSDNWKIAKRNVEERKRREILEKLDQRMKALFKEVQR